MTAELGSSSSSVLSAYPDWAVEPTGCSSTWCAPPCPEQPGGTGGTEREQEGLTSSYSLALAQAAEWEGSCALGTGKGWDELQTALPLWEGTPGPRYKDLFLSMPWICAQTFLLRRTLWDKGSSTASWLFISPHEIKRLSWRSISRSRQSAEFFMQRT